MRPRAARRTAPGSARLRRFPADPARAGPARATARSGCPGPCEPGSKPVRQPRAVVGDRHLEQLLVAARPARCGRRSSTVPPAVGEAVLDGVLHQLGEDHRQRRGVLGPQLAEAAPPVGAHPVPLARGHLDHRARAPVGDLVEVDRLVEALAQRLVHERDRRRPGAPPPQRGPALVVGHPPGLQPQQRGDRLQVVLHPVVDLADRRVLGDQLPLAPAQLGDVAQQQQRADALARRRSAGSPAATTLAPRGLDLGAPRRPAGRRTSGQRLVDRSRLVAQQRR